MGEGISRRGFLKGASLAVLAAGTAGVVSGCASPQGGASTKQAAPAAAEAKGAVPAKANIPASIWGLGEIAEPAKTIDANVCIIGGGGTGLAAAIEATDLGLNTVLLEKAGELGGSFVATEGMFGVGSHWQKEVGYEGTVQEAVERCVKYHHYIPSMRLYKNFFAQTAETIDWLESHGCKFRDVVSLGGPRAWHVYYYDEKAKSPGAYFTNSLAEAAKKTSAQILMSMSGKKILMKDGKVAGVLAADSKGEVTQINAPVVLLATGGFSSNPDFLHAVSPFTVNEHILSLGTPGRDGDGIKMGVDAGVALSEGYGTVMWCGPVALDAKWATDAYSASVQPTLWVNQDAMRFINEDLWIGDFAAGGIATRDQQRTYVIFTEADLASWEKSGPYGQVFTFGTPGKPMSNARKQLSELKSCHKADFIEELAKSVNLDPAALKKTVDAYNGFCKSGVDEEFNKKPEHLTPVEQGPFYILEVADGYYTTVGGLEINENVEALNDKQEVIPGLYVGGCDTGSLYGDSYDVSTAPGSQASWAINSGRLAMKNAAKYLGKK